MSNASNYDWEKAKEICEKASPGEWTVFQDSVVCGEKIIADVFGDNDIADAEFIAAARTLLPAALDKIEVLTKQNHALREALKTTTKWMEFWLENFDCDCGELPHFCGYKERKAELKQAKQVLKSTQALGVEG